MPILRPHAARFHELRISSMTFTLAHLYGKVYMQVEWLTRWPIRSILGFCIGEQSSHNVRFPASDADEPPCKIRRR